MADSKKHKGNPNWVKGKSANPGGCPTWYKEIAALAGEKCPRAIERLCEWMEQETNPGASVRACEILLDRGLGKPKQQLEHTGLDGEPISIAVTFVEAKS